VTTSRTAMTKTGRPFVSFTVEDFNGSVQFTLFGKDYENFMKYTNPNTPILMKVAIMQKYGYMNQNQDDVNKPVDCELKIKSMRLLSNTKEDFIRSITLNIPALRIDKQFRKDMVTAFKENKGSTRVIIKVLDYESQISAEFFSSKYLVALTDDFFSYLSNEGIEWSVAPTLSF
jgi:DNA polymerase-3 subunit alpha